MPRALLSVYDKTGLVDFARALAERGWDLVASGGTERTLREAGLAVTPVEQLTGMPEMLDGRVKTLHPAIHAAILARDTERDLAELRDAGYAPIAMVVCNLYPFQETVAQEKVTLQDALEQIDIGGVALLRAAAKNFLNVTVVCDPADYGTVLETLESDDSIHLALRRELAMKAFAYTRDYDTAIHAYLSRDMAPRLDYENLPEHLSLGGHRIEVLRYGENPHQTAAYYGRMAGVGPLGGTMLGGKQLSYNNILDLDAAWRVASAFDEPVVAIVKHLTPCGIATGETLADAYPRALASDPVSAFGGVIAVNQTVDEGFVEALGALFVEVIAAPGFTDAALALLGERRKNCRLLAIPRRFDALELEVRSVHGGLLVQRPDIGDPPGTTLRVVTRRAPSTEEYEALKFAWKCVQHVKSNAIVIASQNATLGIGGGLPSRVDAVELAVKKAGERARGAVLASDAFFPFADGIQVAAAAGITAIIQPGGSIRDNEVIRAADDANIAMVFTNVRHFRH
ncbi:MAG: bifunctional phosphoribosylaminoimidazolecarboxamide formyltransferase/IMP cyclohydrolase [Chloroflexota bacterium]